MIQEALEDNHEWSEKLPADNLQEDFSDVGLMGETNLLAEHEPPDNFDSLSRKEIITLMEQCLGEPDFSSVQSRINVLRKAFQNISQNEKQVALDRFIEEGGDKADFKFEEDELEIKFRELVRMSHKKRQDFLHHQEKQREENLRTKEQILAELKHIIQNEENMGKAFHAFHELQERWRNTGAVPQNKANDLWMTYKLFVDKFYELIKLNRELQELDHRKNLEMKINICEQAEALMLEPSLQKALHRINMLQNQWRETGAVSRDRRAEIGERFKAACDHVFERRKEYAAQVKEQFEKNLTAKSELCERASLIVLSENPSFQEVNDKLAAMKQVQEDWRQIGPADKEKGEKVWLKFKSITDQFYKQRNEFFAKRKKEYQANLQAKTELCIQAEGLAGSTDWRQASAEIRKLHEAWKKIGPVQPKLNDKIWNRFKSATDNFYNSKKNHFAGMEKEQESNYQRKKELIEKMSSFTFGANRVENFEAIRKFQQEWNEAGMVPLSKKDDIYSQYKKALDALFDRLKISEKEKRDMRFREKLDHLKSQPHAKEKLNDEKRHIQNKISSLNNEVTTLENNLGFFAKSKNADQIIKEFEQKIVRAKEEVAKLREQLAMLKSSAS